MPAVDVDATTVSGHWWRHMPSPGDPAYRPRPAADSRWQRGHVVDALCLAGDADGMWSEWYRHLAESGIPPLQAMPRDAWEYRVGPVEVANLSTADRLDRAGLSLPTPGKGDWPPFQQVGELLYTHRWAGILTVSAARHGSLVLGRRAGGDEDPRPSR